MKDFDIEKLPRENIFTEPKGFYEDMQSNVLQKITPVSRRKIISLKWPYGAAAAVALLVGVSVVMNQEAAVETPSMTAIDPTNVSPTTYTLPTINPKKEDAIALKVLESDLSFVEEVHPKGKLKTVSTNGSSSFASRKRQKANPNPEVQVDQILASFTSAELAVVGKNTEQDVYLDLYN